MWLSIRGIQYIDTNTPVIDVIIALAIAARKYYRSSILLNVNIIAREIPRDGFAHGRPLLYCPLSARAFPVLRPRSAGPVHRAI